MFTARRRTFCADEGRKGWRRGPGFLSDSGGQGFFFETLHYILSLFVSLFHPLCLPCNLDPNTHAAARRKRPPNRTPSVSEPAAAGTGSVSSGNQQEAAAYVEVKTGRDASVISSALGCGCSLIFPCHVSWTFDLCEIIWSGCVDDHWEQDPCLECSNFCINFL